MALTITLTETAAKKINDFMAQTGKEGYGCACGWLAGLLRLTVPVGDR